MAYYLSYLLGGRVGSSVTFNVDDGYLEAMVRGLKAGLLRTSDYASLTQCDTLEDVRLHLQGTALGDFLRNEPSPLTTAAMSRRLTERLVQDFEHMRTQAVPPLSEFLDMIRVGYMLDNVILIILGNARGRRAEELLDKCHPLGRFDAMEALCTVTSAQDLYNMVLIDTPLGPYFAKCLGTDDIHDMDTEIMRNELWKAYLEDFARFCGTLGGPTEEVMEEVLGFEADRRMINIAINSFPTELTRDDKKRLFPDLGRLFPDGIERLARAEDMNAVMQAVEVFPPYRQLLNDVQFNPGKSLEDAFYEYEVNINKGAFERQFGYGIFMSYIRLREQEIRNIIWISECIAQNHRDHINNFIPIF